MSTMCHKPFSFASMRAAKARAQQGFALVSAIILLLIMAGLAAFMVSFSSVQNSTSAQDLQGAKAYQAARAGLEWGLFQVLQTPACAGATWILPGGLNGFSVAVTCQNIGTYTENAAPVVVHRITATASFGQFGSSTYVERQLEATVAK